MEKRLKNLILRLGRTSQQCTEMEPEEHPPRVVEVTKELRTSDNILLSAAPSFIGRLCHLVSSIRAQDKEVGNYTRSLRLTPIPLSRYLTFGCGGGGCAMHLNLFLPGAREGWLTLQFWRHRSNHLPSHKTPNGGMRRMPSGYYHG